MGYVTFVDRWIGHLLESIDRLNLLDDTVVMFVSDHGTQLMDKGKFGKGGTELYPFNTQINWMIRHPNGPRDHHVDAWIQNHDLTPTILNLLGVDHAQLDGVDAWAIATGASNPVRDHITTGWGQFMNVRDDRYSGHFKATDADPEAVVYDLVADPEEENPLVNPPADVVQKILDRARNVVGELPVTFSEYKQRHPARSMRTFFSR